MLFPFIVRGGAVVNAVVLSVDVVVCLCCCCRQQQ